MNSNIVYPIIIIINIFCGVGLLLGVFTDPFEFLSPYFKGEIEDELILFAQSIVNVTAVHQIAIGLFISVLWKSKLDNESNKKVFLAYSVFGGTVLLVALYNHFFMGGGPPIPILILIISATLLSFYSSKFSKY